MVTVMVSLLDQHPHHHLDELQDQKNTVYLNFSDLELTTAIDSVDKKEYYGLLYIPAGKTDEEIASHIEFFAQEAPSNFFLSDLEQKISNEIGQLIPCLTEFHHFGVS